MLLSFKNIDETREIDAGKIESSSPCNKQNGVVISFGCIPVFSNAIVDAPPLILIIPAKLCFEVKAK